MRILFVLCFLMLTALPATARMYQWTDPDSGRTHLSGTPPGWYRHNTHQGPRVFVFRKGELIDDTRIRVSDQRRRELRQQALHDTAASADKPRLKADAAPAGGQSDDYALPPQMVFESGARRDLPELQTTLEDNGRTGETALSPAQIAALRALISQWETENEARNQARAERLLNPDTDDARPAVTREEVQRYLEQQVPE